MNFQISHPQKFMGCELSWELLHWGSSDVRAPTAYIEKRKKLNYAKNITLWNNFLKTYYNIGTELKNSKIWHEKQRKKHTYSKCDPKQTIFPSII